MRVEGYRIGLKKAKKAWAIALASVLFVGVGVARASTGFTSSDTISSSDIGKTLQDGKVYVVSDDLGAYITASYTESALSVADGATVVIYIPGGKKLTVNGGYASGTTGAGAGIRLNSGSTLIVTGGGELVARGGEAENGVGGGNGTAGNFRSGLDYWTAGYGGNGGNGGGGAAAAIGGVGGNGGNGGSRGTSWENECHYFDANEYTANGSSGNGGSSGGNGTSSGTLYLLGSLKATATGGSKGSGGGGGSAGSRVAKKK